MFISNETAVSTIFRYNEFVTPDYIGNLPGDPRGGATRVLLDNGVGGFNSFFIGTQENGSEFVLDDGKIGVIDWGGFTCSGRDFGTNNLKLGSNSQVFSMARTVGPSTNQVTGEGKKVLIGWLKDDKIGRSY